MNYEPAETYDQKLAKAILYTLSWHVGKGKAIGRMDLVQSAEVRACKVGERVMRDTIRLLRREGQLICSAPGEEGGYYLAETWQEFQEFTRAEYEAKISDMSETLKAMKKAAVERWGEAQQPRLL
jgi:hypothetical protein